MPLRYYKAPVLCEKCGTRLHPRLIAIGYATHPLCDPSDQPWRWKQ